jgi:hypothetical protein
MRLPGTVLMVFDVKTMNLLGMFTDRRIADDFMVEMAMNGFDVFVMYGQKTK